MFDIENETDYPSNVEKMAILYVGDDMVEVFHRYHEELQVNLPSIIKDFLNTKIKEFFCKSVIIRNSNTSGLNQTIKFEALCSTDNGSKSLKCRIEVRKISVSSTESYKFFKDGIGYMSGGFQINTFEGYLQLVSDEESRLENKFTLSIAENVKSLIKIICKDNRLLNGSISDIKFYHSSLYDVTLHKELSEMKGIDKSWHTVKFTSNLFTPFDEMSHNVCFIFKGYDCRVLTLERKK